MKLDGTDTDFIYTARKMIGEGRIVSREIGEPLELGENLACQMIFRGAEQPHGVLAYRKDYLVSDGFHTSELRPDINT